MPTQKQEDYAKNSKLYEQKPSIWIAGGKAFIVGGFICFIGQVIINFYDLFLVRTREDAIQWMLVTLIFISSFMTGLGWYRKVAQSFGAGILVLITGLTNLMTSSAMEHRNEGIIEGVAGNVLKLAGAVVVAGVVMAYVVSAVRLIIHAIISG